MNNESKAYMTFTLGDEKFAIPVEHVQEVVEFGQVTKVPNAPAYMLGIINLRGCILPLLDTKLKLGLKATEATRKSRIMVINTFPEAEKNVQLGAVVDVAREVIEIKPDEIREAPEIHNLKDSAPISGIVNNHGDITMIMDIERVFSTTDINDINTSLT